MIKSPFHLIVLRVFVALSVLVSSSILAFASGTFANSAILDESLDIGLLFVFMYMALGALALADTLVNDILPARYTLKWTLPYRNLVFMLIALCAGGVAFIVSKQGAPNVVTLRYILDGSVAAFVGTSSVTKLIYDCIRYNRLVKESAK